ncbi:Magnesium/cobalt efflux protein [Halomonas sp. NYA30]
MKVRDLFSALQRGDLSVVSEVTDVMSELADAIDMLHIANPYEQIEVVEHLKGLDDEEPNNLLEMIGLLKKNDWF